MGELQVRTGDRRLTLAETECLGIGRVNVEPGGTKGWGYDGRFLELDQHNFIHRIWAELIWNQGLWRVRSLGTRHPVVVIPAAFRPIELPPVRPGGVPHEFAVTQREFVVQLSVSTETYELECSTTDEAELPAMDRPLGGSDTMTLGDELAAGITATEFQVLWVMAREYREPSPSSDPAPLSYSRICHALGLSNKQAVSAVERIVKRFRASGAIPADLPAAEQRDWVCRQVVAHSVLDTLCERHGTPAAD